MGKCRFEDYKIPLADGMKIADGMKTAPRVLN